MKTTSCCLDCGLANGHEITCAFADDEPTPPAPPARTMYHAVVDGVRRVSVCLSSGAAPETVKAKLCSELERRIYQDTYAPVESVPLFTVESEAARPHGRRRA